MDQRPHIDFWIGQQEEPQDAPADMHAVPAEVLANVLLHAQRAIHLLALSTIGQEVRQRARVPAEVRRQFQLVCLTPREGSFVQPTVLAGEGDLFTPQLAMEIMDGFKSVGEAVSQGTWDALAHSVPDREYRLRIANEFRQMMPGHNERWLLALESSTGVIARFDAMTNASLQAYLRDARRPPGPLVEPATLAGEVVIIDFAERKLTIRHHPSQRAIDCEYADDLEEMLVQNRRDWVHVTGLVELDSKDQPIRLTDVFEIRSLDLSDMLVDRVLAGSQVLSFREAPKSFCVRLDETGSLLVVDDDELGLHVYAETREQLHDLVLEEIEILWNEYVVVDQDNLTSSALKLRTALLEAIEPEAHAEA